MTGNHKTPIRSDTIARLRSFLDENPDLDAEGIGRDDEAAEFIEDVLAVLPDLLQLAADSARSKGDSLAAFVASQAQPGGPWEQAMQAWAGRIAELNHDVATEDGFEVRVTADALAKAAGVAIDYLCPEGTLSEDTVNAIVRTETVMIGPNTTTFGYLFVRADRGERVRFLQGLDEAGLVALVPRIVPHFDSPEDVDGGDAEDRPIFLVCCMLQCLMSVPFERAVPSIRREGHVWVVRMNEYTKDGPTGVWQELRATSEALDSLYGEAVRFAEEDDPDWEEDQCSLAGVKRLIGSRRLSFED